MLSLTDNPLSHRDKDLPKASAGASQDASYLPGENNFLETLPYNKNADNVEYKGPPDGNDTTQTIGEIIAIA